MRIVYIDFDNNPIVNEKASVDTAINALHNLDNKTRSYLQVSLDDLGRLLIRGSNQGRVVVHVRGKDKNGEYGGSHLIDSGLENTDLELDFSYSGGLMDPFNIRQTVPLEIGEEVIRYYFDHQSIRNYDRYKWEGYVEPDPE